MPTEPQSGRTSERWWALVEKLVIPILILVVGWWVKDSVDQALERERLDLAYASEMQDLLVKLVDREQSLTDQKAAALTLSIFGEPAIPPLMILLQDPERLGALAAKDGLRAAAVRHPEEVCRVLRRAVARGRRQPWQVYLQVVELIGEEGCLDARGDLEELRDDLSGSREEAVAALAERSRDGQPNFDSVQQLRQELERALASLERAEG